MSKWFERNIEGRGRLLRGVIALLLLVAAVVAFTQRWWLGWILLAVGGFVLFEAVRGWCVMRACGIKTRF